MFLEKGSVVKMFIILQKSKLYVPKITIKVDVGQTEPMHSLEQLGSIYETFKRYPIVQLRECGEEW